MNKIVAVPKNLPPEGKRLSGGLALRLSRGNGMTVLGCSRVGQPPSETEMETVLAAVVDLWQPSVVWRGRVTISQRWFNGAWVEDHIWRLYWPMESLEQMYAEPVQDEFVF